MSTLVTATLHRLFFMPTRRPAVSVRRPVRKAHPRGLDTRSPRIEFAETRPVIFRSEGFAEDLVLSHGVA
jgi:hypothetical protein